MIPGQQEQFKIPRELERRPPRPVRRRAGTLGCGTLGARFIAIIFLGAGLFVLGRIPVIIAVVTHGESHPGTVMKTWISKSGRRSSTSYHVRYAYEAAGQVHSDSRTVSHEQYDQLSASPPALPLDVKALSIGGTYFDQMFLPGESLWGPVWWAVLVAAIVNGVAGLISYYIWIVPWQHRKLCREGKPIVGHITRMHSSSGKTTTYYLDYEFDQPGLGVRVATMTVTSERWHQAQVSEPVTVLCYPNRKRPTVMYEYGDFECF
ncbi:MAG TPA: hypothetical protein VGP99_13145 [Tepidisphaeraceae bacterium]|jgi:hypothetical protein|nr:hypothetical protein [Tepidisphaeraceae bacterium]